MHKMIRKVTSLLLVFALLISLFPMAVFANDPISISIDSNTYLVGTEMKLTVKSTPKTDVIINFLKDGSNIISYPTEILRKDNTGNNEIRLNMSGIITAGSWIVEAGYAGDEISAYKQLTFRVITSLPPTAPQPTVAPPTVVPPTVAPPTVEPPVATPSPSPTPSESPTPSPTATPTPSPTATPTPSPTPTKTPAVTPGKTATPTPTPEPTLDPAAKQAVTEVENELKELEKNVTSADDAVKLLDNITESLTSKLDELFVVETPTPQPTAAATLAPGQTATPTPRPTATPVGPTEEEKQALIQQKLSEVLVKSLDVVAEKIEKPADENAALKSAETLTKVADNLTSVVEKVTDAKAQEKVTEKLQELVEKTTTSLVDNVKTEAAAVKAVESTNKLVDQLSNVLENTTSKNSESNALDAVYSAYNAIGDLASKKIETEEASQQVLDTVSKSFGQAGEILDKVNDPVNQEKFVQNVANLAKDSAAALEVIKDPEKALEQATNLIEQTANVVDKAKDSGSVDALKNSLADLAETVIKKAATTEIKEEEVQVSEDGGVKAEISFDTLTQAADKAEKATEKMQETFAKNNIQTEIKQEVSINLPVIKPKQSSTENTNNENNTGSNTNGNTGNSNQTQNEVAPTVEASVPAEALQQLVDKGIDLVNLSMGNGTGLKMDLSQQNEDSYQYSFRELIRIMADQKQGLDLLSSPQANGSVAVELRNNQKKINEYFRSKAVQLQLNDLPDPIKDKERLALYKKVNDKWVAQGGKLDKNEKGFTASISGSGEYKLAESEKEFKDSGKLQAWAKRPVQVMAAKGVVNESQENFKPDAAVTRAEFIKMLVTSTELLDKKATTKLEDVKPGDWHYLYVASAEKAGIIKGTNGKFNPSAKITRQEMAKMVADAAEKLYSMKTNQADALIAQWKDKDKIPDWAKNAIAVMQKNGLMNGSGGDNFAPKQTVTRAQATTLIYRFYNIPS